MSLLRIFFRAFFVFQGKLVCILLPYFPLGMQKSLLANHPNAKVRRNALIALGAKVHSSCYLNQGIRIVMDYPSTSNIEIGDRVSVAPNVQFICNSGPHPESELLNIEYVKRNLAKNKGIRLASDVWIGTGAIILPGVNIGRCSVVGAGALVINDVPSFSVVAGIPAKVIRVLDVPLNSVSQIKI